MSDPRGFIKLHNGMPENPKIVGLSDEAFRALIELWCYCGRNLTDGHVPGAQANRLASAKALAELVLAQLVDETGNHYTMHHYTKHQQTKAEVEDIRHKRRDAGTLGGRARANAQASAQASAKQVPKQNPSKTQADRDRDRDRDLTTPQPLADAPGFDDFWAAYPRKDDKGRARPAWSKAVKKTDPQTIVDAATNYATTADRRENGKFIKLPATWLNAEAWDNVYALPKVVSDHERLNPWMYQ